MHTEIDEDTNEQEEIPRIENISLLSGINKSSSRFPSWVTAFKNKLQSNVWSKIALISFKEALQSKRSLLISFFSCLLVVVVVSSLITIISNAPVVFLKMAEAEEGEIDVRITSNQPDDTLNFTVIWDQIKDDQQYSYASPRYHKTIPVFPPCCQNVNNCKSTNCTDSNQYDDDNAFKAEIFLIDSKRERKMNLGKEWIEQGYENPQSGHLFMSQNLASALQVSVGDNITLKIDPTSFFGKLWNSTINQTIDSVFVPTTVALIYPSPMGKYSTYTTNAIIMELQFFLPYFCQFLNSSLPQQSTFCGKDLYDYSPEVLWNLSPPRTDSYLDNDIDNINARLTKFSSSVEYLIGFPRASSELPVLASLQQTSAFSFLLGMVINVVVMIALVLSIILVYSLLSIDVESRALELAKLRAIGMNRIVLGYMLLWRAVIYVVPSCLLGLLVSQLLVLLVAEILKAVQLEINPLLSSSAILVTLFLATVVPFLASVIPIKEVLSANISETLEFRRSKTSGVEISVNRSEKTVVFSWQRTLFSAAIVAFGFFIYYVFPYSLLSQDMDMLLFIFVFLLVGMILGLVMLSLNLIVFSQKVVLKLFFWWESDLVVSTIHKNMASHRLRNQSTSIMFALSVGFVIFLAVSFSIQSESFFIQQSHSAGAFMLIYAYGTSASPVNYFKNISSFENVVKNNPRIVQAHTWVSAPLSQAFGLQAYQEVSNLGHVFTVPVEVYAVGPNFFDVSYSQYLIQSSLTPHKYASGQAMLDQLYSIQGYSSGIIGGYTADTIGTTSEPSFLINTQPDGFLAKLDVLAVLDLCPYFDEFSKYKSDLQAVLVSYPTYVRLSQNRFKSVEDIPMHAVLFKFQHGASNSDIDYFKNQLSGVIVSTQQDSYLGIWDYRQSTVRGEMVRSILLYLFSFAIVIAMTICSFSLISSVFSNILRQTKEIAILLVLGASKSQLYRIYIYEAFLLVFISSVFGTLIGWAMAWLLVLQQLLYTQLPTPVTFPYELLSIMLVTSAIFAVLSTWRPLKGLFKKNLTQLLQQP